MYAGDNPDTMVLNWLAASGAPASNTWVNGHVDSLPNATNTAPMAAGVLFSYNQSYGNYRCPSAQGKCLAGIDASLLSRTVSMNSMMGGANVAEASEFGVEDTGGISGFSFFRKVSDIRNPPTSSAQYGSRSTLSGLVK